MQGGPWYLTSVLAGRSRMLFWVGAATWLAAFVYFWAWWLRPEHILDPVSYGVVSLSLGWITVIPAYFILIFANGSRPTGGVPAAGPLRVAMVVTKAPSEPFDIVARTLEAMLAQDYPHDTWLADERPSPETVAWCQRNGVLISTRQDHPEYHRKTWPRRTRCKEGNLAFFYDHYGYERYDVVAQLDADHVPEPGYLREMVRPFADPRVGYVSAPSICDSNAHESWSARGRLYAEASMHGSLQAGYNGGWAPLCIGSHYAVRTAALKEIGGLGPELAEDHSTTLMMNAAGWRGIHALDAIAHGEGPKTFTDLVTQEFQWSRSLVMLLLQYSPRYVPQLSGRLKFQFLFSQLWYPLFALFMALGFLMPILALVLDTNFVAVTYPAFLLHFFPLSLVLVVLAFQWRSSGTFRPYDAKVLSWEILVFLFARWPWALLGTIAALREWAMGTYVDFRVTPKGVADVDPVPLRVLAPYAVLSGSSALAALLTHDVTTATGFYFFAVVNALIYAGVFATILIGHHRENRVRRTSAFRAPAVALAAVALLAMPALVAQANGPRALGAILYGTGVMPVTEVKYRVSGAGMGDDPRIVRLNFGWQDPGPTDSATAGDDAL
jgi:cellulose synthase/poly-beta-1,6-N-acetylglucosamine synthase-like glycosyltransferase